MSTKKIEGLKVICLDQLEPNPYRHFKTYPILPEKIEALIESIGATGFWGETVIARPADKGKYQIAFGHHRIEAARKKLGKKAAVEISVRNLDDTQMLAMMSRENDETYTNTADMDLEVVRAAIEGFADGRIDLPAPKPARNQKDNATGLTPDQFGFSSGKLPQLKFTRDGLVELLGKPHHRIVDALRNLKLMNKEHIVKQTDYQGLKRHQAKVLSREVQKVERKAGAAAARKAAGRIAREIKEKDKVEGAAGKHPSEAIAKRVSKEIIEEHLGKQLPDINEVAKTLGDTISRFLRTSDLSKRLKEVVKYKESLSRQQLRDLIAQLETLETTAAKYRNELQGTKSTIRLVKQGSR